MSRRRRYFVEGLMVAMWIGLWNGKACAQEIPAFDPIPPGLSAAETQKLEAIRKVGEEQIAQLQADAAKFNALDAEQQTQAQYAVLQSRKKTIIDWVNYCNEEARYFDFNHHLDSQSDTSVVDARGAKEPVPAMGDEIEKSPGVEEAHKGYKCVANHDWPAAIAWFQQALVKDPNNGALKNLVDLGTFTVEREKEWKAEENRSFTDQFYEIEKQLLMNLSAELNAKARERNNNRSNETWKKFMQEVSDAQSREVNEYWERFFENQSPGSSGKTESDLSRSIYGGIVKESWMMAVNRAVGFLGVGEPKKASVDLGWLEVQLPKMTQFHEALEALKEKEKK